MGTVTIANVAGNVYTVTLTSLVATRKWPLYSVGYFVRINQRGLPGDGANLGLGDPDRLDGPYRPTGV
jgi:hypothetical protein